MCGQCSANKRTHLCTTLAQQDVIVGAVAVMYAAGAALWLIAGTLCHQSEGVLDEQVKQWRRLGCEAHATRMLFVIQQQALNAEARGERMVACLCTGTGTNSAFWSRSPMQAQVRCSGGSTSTTFDQQDKRQCIMKRSAPHILCRRPWGCRSGTGAAR